MLGDRILTRSSHYIYFKCLCVGSYIVVIHLFKISSPFTQSVNTVHLTSHYWTKRKCARVSSRLHCAVVLYAREQSHLVMYMDELSTQCIDVAYILHLTVHHSFTHGLKPFGFANHSLHRLAPCGSWSCKKVGKCLSK